MERHLSLAATTTREEIVAEVKAEPALPDATAREPLAPTLLDAQAIAQALDTGADVSELAQRVAEAHLAACQEAEWASQEGEEILDSPAVAPFCGCDTCIVREVLTAAWPVIEAALRRELTSETTEPTV